MPSAIWRDCDLKADASQFSKLGFASDMNSLSYRYKVYNAAGVCTMSAIDTVTRPTVDSYLIVYYQEGGVHHGPQTAKSI